MDMYMKNLKPIIFTTHSELKSVVPSIKKSHLYEAFAAFCGFKSYAAFQTSTNICIENHELANRRCFERVQGLGFDAGESLQVCQRIQQAWEQFNIISLDDVYAFYAEASFEEALSASRMLNALTSLIDENDAEAVLVAIVIAAQILATYEENPDNRSGEYWYNKKLANQTINELQSEVADQYQQIVPYRELLTLILRKVENSNDAVLPSPSILKTISEQFGDNRKRYWSDYFSNEPYAVIEAIGYALHCHDADEPVIPFYIYLDWIKAQMLVYPSRERLIEIIEATNNKEVKWFWHLIGLQHNIDVTQSNLRAIHADTGEDYDDYGPMDVVGDEGLSLPNIQNNRKAKLESEAIKLTS